MKDGREKKRKRVNIRGSFSPLRVSVVVTLAVFARLARLTGFTGLTGFAVFTRLTNIGGKY